MGEYIDADKLFEFIQKEKAWKQGTQKQPRYEQGKYDALYEVLKIIREQPIVDIGDISINRLAEICEAEREGRLRILVRHSVPHNTKAYIYDHYDELQQGKIIHGKNAYAMRFICETTAFDISNYDIGRNVFLTREEAEKALAEMEENNE